MQDNVQSQRVVSGGGLNTLNNYLTLSGENPGAAVALVNFETSLSGGYRRINGFIEYDSTYPSVDDTNAEGAILGVWGFVQTQTDDLLVIAARKQKAALTYKLYYLDPFGTGWIAFAPGFTLSNTNAVTGTTVRRVRAQMFNPGDGNQIIFVDGVNPAYVYDGASWYQLLSTNAGGSGSPGGNQLIDKPSVVTLFKNYLLISGDETAPAVVAYSAPADALTWTAAAGGGQVIFGQPVQTLKPFRDECYVFGLSNIKKLVPDAGATFLFQDVTNDLGCVAKDSVLEIAGSLIFMANDGIRPIAGTDKINDVELGLLSENIQDTIDTTFRNFDMKNLSGLTIRGKTQFRYFYSDDSYGVESGQGLLGSVRRNPQTQSNTRWEFSNLLGIRCSSCWSGIVQNRELVLHGDYDGKVYKQEDGNSFNGADITAIYTSPYLDLSDTELRKTMREITVFAKTEGTVSLTLNVRFDWGRSTAQVPQAYSVDMTGAALFDDPSSTYGTTVFGGVARSVVSTPIQGSGMSVQYTFSTVDSSAPYTIHGFVHEFTPAGRQ